MSVRMSRAEHLAWAKKRAIEYASRGDVTGALGSITSDLRKHPETADHSGLGLMAMLAMVGHLDQPRELREFIEGFN